MSWWWKNWYILFKSRLDVLKADFLYLESENKKIESCISQVKLLKKKRLTKIQSNIKCTFDGDPFDLDLTEYCDDDQPF